MNTIDRHDSEPTAGSHYRRPDWFSRRLLAPLLVGVMRLGVSVYGSRVLEHRGRRTGHLYRTPVNLLSFQGAEYLVSARGDTEWVRNVWADGGRVVLLVGRHRRVCRAVEVPVADRPPVLRAYLRRWNFEVGMFFDGVGPQSTDAELLAVAARHPVFSLA